jgi:hypothetical protein
MVKLLLHHRLAVAELLHVGIGIGKGGVDRFELFEEVDGLLHPFLHYLAHGLGAIDQRFLFEIADGVAGGEDGLAGEVLVDAGQDAQQRTLARAVEAEDADLGAVIVRELDLFEDRYFVVKFAHADHGVNYFGIDAHRFFASRGLTVAARKSGLTT